eukprot:7736776-Pyramimonas_sp.AAC.1
MHAVSLAAQHYPHRSLIPLGVVERQEVQLKHVKGVMAPEDCNAVVVSTGLALQPKLPTVGGCLWGDRHCCVVQVLQ